MRACLTRVAVSLLAVPLIMVALLTPDVALTIAGAGFENVSAAAARLFSVATAVAVPPSFE